PASTSLCAMGMTKNAASLRRSRPRKRSSSWAIVLTSRVRKPRNSWQWSARTTDQAEAGVLRLPQHHSGENSMADNSGSSGLLGVIIGVIFVIGLAYFFLGEQIGLR